MALRHRQGWAGATETPGRAFEHVVGGEAGVWELIDDGDAQIRWTVGAMLDDPRGGPRPARVAAQGRAGGG